MFFFSGVDCNQAQHYRGHYCPIVPASDDKCGAVGGMLGRGNRSTRRKPAQAPLCPPQIPLWPDPGSNHGATVGSQRLIAWATARPNRYISTTYWNMLSRNSVNNSVLLCSLTCRWQQNQRPFSRRGNTVWRAINLHIVYYARNFKVRFRFNVHALDTKSYCLSKRSRRVHHVLCRHPYRKTVLQTKQNLWYNNEFGFHSLLKILT
jgi:hypothetical protein